MSKYLILLSICIPFLVTAQKEDPFKYIDGKELTIAGRSALVDPSKFHRIDSADRVLLPKSVQQLAKHSSGINIIFQTNATSIKVKWTLQEFKILWNMTPLAVNGLDLYGWNGTSWQYVSSARPSDVENSTTFIKNMDGKMRHFKIYLPLYTGLQNINVGVEEQAVIKPADNNFLPMEKVVVYGSSITQGASASRPGMAYPSIIERNLNVETFNLGFSGSGKMEIEVADVLGAMEADLYILDCVPNPSPEQIEERTVPFIRRLRQLKPNVPILMVESIFRENGHWDAAINDLVTQQNDAFDMAYRQLKEEDYKQLFYIPSEELIVNDHGSTVDGVHLSDLGFAEIADRIGKSVDAILRNKF